MIDFATYRKLHPDPAPRSTDVGIWGYEDGTAKSDKEMMHQENPPEDEMINILPFVTVGFNIRLKKWSLFSHSQRGESWLTVS
jgi:hypothetical protein